MPDFANPATSSAAPTPAKLTNEQFAARIKSRAPELASVPDADLVRKVLERRPDMASFLVTEVPRQPTTRHEPFAKRVLARTDEAAEGVSRLVPNLLADAKSRFKSAKDTGNYREMALAPLRAELGTLAGVGKGIAGVSAPGMAVRAAKGEDPANFVADAALMMIPSGEPSAVAAKATEALKSEMTPSIVGAHTRAIEGFRTVERQAGHVPVDPAPVMEWVQKAQELSQKGYQMPKVMSDFARWVEGKQRTSLQPAPGGGAIDTPGTSMPLTVRDAREFYTALNEAIPWNEEGYGGRNGRMFYTVDQARKALQQSTVRSLEPFGLDRTLNQAMSDYSRVARWREKSYGVGWLGGKIAGYGAGAALGHPLMLGYLGGKGGEGIAGSMVKSVTEAGGNK